MKINLIFLICLSTCILSNGVASSHQKSINTKSSIDYFQQKLLPKNHIEKINNPWVEKVLQEHIQTEVNHTFRRITPLLNTWLVFLLMLSTATVSGTWLLLVKLAQQIKVCREEIDTVKYDTLAHITYLASDAEVVANGIRKHLKVAQQQIENLPAETILISGNEPQQNLEPPTESPVNS